jgi:5-methylthioadenosine/S-adenosylhomocysteine deaminase
VSRTLLRGDHVVVGDGSVHSPGFVLTDGPVIVAVGSGDGGAHADGAVVLGGRHRIVMPGLVNAHTHLFQTVLRNLADDLDHTTWLGAVIGANAGRLTGEDLELAATLGAMESLRGGITTIVDNHYVHSVADATDRVCGALAASGVRAWVARGSADRVDALARASGPEAVRVTCETPEAYLAAVEAAAARWHGAAEGRMSIALATQAAWLCSDDLASRLATYGADNGLLFHAHCAETTTSVKRTLDAHGTTDEGFFSRSGLVRPGTSLVHGVHISDDEIDDVAAHGGSVVHCPVANAYLASGVAPVAALRAAGVNVALGTDGAASNDRQDAFEVVKWAALLPRLGGSAATVTGRGALDMAWRGGATAVGRAGSLGLLAPGACADVVLVSTEGPHLRPLHDPVAALAFNARPDDVDTVLVDGRIVVERGKCTLIDEDDVLRRCDERSATLGLAVGPRTGAGVLR